MENPDIEVPGPDAQWWTEISEFALTFNAYFRGSSFDAVASLDEQVRQSWEMNATLPNDLDVCRSILFFEQRRFRHLDVEPVGEDDCFIRAVLGQIRALSNGRILGPPDPPP